MVEDYKRHKVQGTLRFEVGGKKIEMRTIDLHNFEVWFCFVSSI